jgi:hypothetical protein
MRWEKRDQRVITSVWELRLDYSWVQGIKPFTESCYVVCSCVYNYSLDVVPIFCLGGM